jgi:N-acetylglucosaminyl-diphospho-decaprenol L-rhamnosyltransferase
MSIPRVRVAVVAFQSGKFLQLCLDALAAQTFTDFECVVADNASTDGSMEALRLPDHRFWVQAMGANLGFAVANNRAFNDSQAEFLVTLNADAAPEPMWLQELVAAAQRWPKAASVGSTQVDLRDPSRLDGVGDMCHVAGVAWRARLGWPVAAIPPEGEVFGACAAAALYRREAFEKQGGFHEPYFCYCEDVDLAYRLRLAGWIIVQAPKAVVRHAGSGISGRTSDFTLFHGHRNRVWTYLRCTPGAWVWLLMPYHLAFNLWLAVGARKFGGTGTIFRAYAAAVRGLPQIFAERRLIQASRRVSAKEVFRVMAWSPMAPKRRDVVTLGADALKATLVERDVR